MDVAGLRKIDKATFTIRLTHENPLFLYALTLEPTAIVPVEAVRFYKDRFSVNPVGTGPFMATRRSIARARCTWCSNPDYYRVYPGMGAPGDAEKGLLKDAGKRLPLVDVLDMPLDRGAAARGAEVPARRARPARRWIAPTSPRWSRARPTARSRLAEPTPAKFNLASAPGGNMRLHRAEHARPGARQEQAAAPGHRRRHRRGRDHQRAVQRPRHRAAERRAGGHAPATSTTPARRAQKRDLALAKKLLAEAGYPDGKGLPPLTMRLLGARRRHAQRVRHAQGPGRRDRRAAGRRLRRHARPS